MSRKVIKNWKVVRSELGCVTAFNIFKNRVVNGRFYDIIGLRLGSRTFQSGINNIETESFAASEILSDKWEILIPDDNMEEILERMRELYKNEHIGNLKYQKIDNMSIEDLWDSLVDVMNDLDNRNKYRLAKHIIENKLYKKI